MLALWFSGPSLPLCDSLPWYSVPWMPCLPFVLINLRNMVVCSHRLRTDSLKAILLHEWAKPMELSGCQRLRFRSCGSQGSEPNRESGEELGEFHGCLQLPLWVWRVQLLLPQSKILVRFINFPLSYWGLVCVCVLPVLINLLPYWGQDHIVTVVFVELKKVWPAEPVSCYVIEVQLILYWYQNIKYWQRRCFS